MSANISLALKHPIVYKGLEIRGAGIRWILCLIYHLGCVRVAELEEIPCNTYHL